MNIIPVCSITDENMPFAMATMMISALENAAETTFYKFHCFISGKVSTDDRQKLLSIGASYKNLQSSTGKCRRREQLESEEKN